MSAYVQNFLALLSVCTQNLCAAVLTYMQDLRTFYREETVRGVAGVSVFSGIICVMLVIGIIDQEKAIHGKFEASALRRYRFARAGRIALCLVYVVMFEVLICQITCTNSEMSTSMPVKILIVILAFCALRDLLHLEAGPAAFFQIEFNAVWLVSLFGLNLEYQEMSAFCICLFVIMSLISVVYYYHAGNLLAQKYLGIHAINDLEPKIETDRV